MRKMMFRTTQVLADLGVLAAGFALAFALRFDWAVPTPMATKLLLALPFVVGMQYGALSLLGVSRFSWRFVGLREVVRIFMAVGLSTVVLLAARFTISQLLDGSVIESVLVLPIGVILIDFLLAFVGLCGVRALRRMEAERSARGGRSDIHGEPTLLVGAGMGGVLVAKELERRPELGIRPIGFLDDDPMKHGQVIEGLRVLGGTSAAAAVCAKYGATQALITIANAPRKELRRIALLCEDAGAEAKLIPGLFEIVGGRVNLSRIRKVEIEDLLGREPVHLDTKSIAADVKGKVVLVTGAGGSIGAEICRQLARFEPGLLVLLEQAENSLFHIHRELSNAFPDLALTPIIADVCDSGRMASVFEQFNPDIVFHAAAHKHVPMMEWNPGEAVKNNVFGSINVADLAHAHGVRQFVMISTDKAVNPTSVMGATKRLAEIYVQALSQRSSTRFVTVRFGNVLGSAGSVIPIFQEQIAAGGPVKVTHPEMQRYFMTIPEACQLVLQAGTMGKGSEIFVLDMGEPVKIVDLARDLISLSGLKPGEDIEISFTGIRPGEKLFEELSVAEEQAERTRHPKIFIGKVRPNAWEQVVTGLADLREVANAASAKELRARLKGLIPEYTPVVLDEPAGVVTITKAAS